MFQTTILIGLMPDTQIVPRLSQTLQLPQCVHSALVLQILTQLTCHNNNTHNILQYQYPKIILGLMAIYMVNIFYPLYGQFDEEMMKNFHMKSIDHSDLNMVMTEISLEICPFQRKTSLFHFFQTYWNLSTNKCH